ncbi:MAG: glycine--tRNA ligase subunit beta [Deltaproteobacteria bacterium]|nr:glycine--tRNA ligase subunit beta [Deltaproteobacteria bacterium]
MNPAPLLVEIGCEELPAAVAPIAARWLVEQLAAALGVDHGPATWMATPRRLIAHIDQVPERQADRQETAMGPALAVARAADGTWTRAAEGFARGQGVTVAELTVVETPKGAYVAAHKHIAGRSTAEVVAEALPRLLRTMPLPKRMRWGRQAEAFGRPIHWLVALRGDACIEFSFAGVQSGRLVYGHRFYHPGPLEARAVLARHVANLRDAFVLADPAERQRTIEGGIAQIAAQCGGRWRPDPETLQTVVYLTEWPAPLLGTFADQYLEIPPEVIFTTLRENQKLFLIDGPDGRLLPRFVAIANTLADHSRDTVAAGNARVVSARLSDARFFYREDVRRPLADRVADLDARIWLAGLGTIGDKVRRIETSARALAAAAVPDCLAAVQRAAHLCKADLSTKMVFEFPELQGVIGSYYARAAGEPPEVATAMASHYQPRFAADAIAADPVGQVVAVADKLDTLVGCFALGLLPTGAQDPYSLRRAALGVLRTLGESGGLQCDLSVAVDLAVAQLPAGVRDNAGLDLRDAVVAFLRARLVAQWSDTFGVDVTEAVVEAGFDRVDTVEPRLRALHELRAQPAFAALAAAFKRVANLVKKSADAGDLGAAFAPALCEKAVERALHAQVVQVQAQSQSAISRGDWPAALRTLAQVRPAVDAFFDGVLVMADDAAVRRNRLALLALVAGLFAPIAEFGRLPG